MKQIYRSLINSLERIIVKFQIQKTWIAEWYSIIKKQKQYKSIKWTKTQKNDFNNYWKKNYGKTISNRWHKLYQSANGIFNVKYFPEILFTTKLEPRLNPYFYSKVLSDKSLLELLFKDLFMFPKTIIINCNGIFYDSKRNIISKNEALNYLSKINQKIVIKPIRDTSSGENIRIVTLHQGEIEGVKQSVKELIEQYKKNYIVQKCLNQNSLINTLYPKSINTIRFTSYIANGHIHHMPIYLRLGANGNYVDNIHAGGLGVSISNNGVVSEFAFDNNNNKYSLHPYSKMKFKDYKIPKVDEIIKLAYKAHGRIPHIGIISWDFMIDDCEVVNLIEINLSAQGIWFPQIASGKAAFGDNTDRMLQLIR